MSTTTLPDSKPPGMSTTEAAEVLRAGGKVQHRDWKPWEWMKLDKDGRFRFHNGDNVMLSADTLEKLEGRVWYRYDPEPEPRHHGTEKPALRQEGGTDDARSVLSTMLVALENLACLGNGDRPGTSDGNMIAQHALNAVRPYFQNGELPRHHGSMREQIKETIKPRKPTIGRIVHYYDEFQNPKPAIIVGELPDGRWILTAFLLAGVTREVFAHMGGPDGTTPTLGCWTWPPTV